MCTTSDRWPHYPAMVTLAYLAFALPKVAGVVALT